jgi:hypothetical protein
MVQPREREEGYCRRATTFIFSFEDVCIPGVSKVVSVRSTHRRSPPLLP